MSKIIDRLPNKEGTGTTKGNYTASGMGNDKGSIGFGQIHEKGDVTAGVMLRTPNGKHFMAMDIDGERPDGLPLLDQEILVLKQERREIR